jgi:ParB/Sulfiredoxin domain
VIAETGRDYSRTFACSDSRRNLGAGEGNRTLVISLEGVGTLSNFMVRSDKSTLFGPLNPIGYLSLSEWRRCALAGPLPSLSHRHYLAIVGQLGSTIFPSGHKLDGRPTPQDEKRWAMPETRLIALGDIAVAKHRLRALREDTANALTQSMADQGQLQPIVVRPREHGGYWLVAGLHRLAAAKKLKWKEINCTVFDGMAADEAELAEIDENLIRAELSPAERLTYREAQRAVREGLPGDKERGRPRQGWRR